MTATVRRAPSGLGRGLASLIPQRPQTTGAIEIPVAEVRRNPYQPRGAAEQDALDTLARSIAEHGVLQPILVVETAAGYQLIAGERRLRAAELAGLERVPAVVRTDVAEQGQLELALIENLQRADLNPLEEARAFRRLIDEFGMTQADVAARVARARSSVANTLRLLDLDPAVQAALGDGRISEGHARALGAAPGAEAQIVLLQRVLADGLSVRQTEALAARAKDQAAASARPNASPGGPDGPGGPAGSGASLDDQAATTSPDLSTASPGPTGAAAVGTATSDLDLDPAERERLESDLRLALGTKVTITPGRRGGRIVVEYYDANDLDRLYERLTGRPA
ncbi:MAG TPA: ParB/RepB/Spo0J family partition protein [Candidatus Limnocylindrales bacterium]|nr:ParB/RepB/Spo0J family partition protein [Candidatus Limnocylindrales bacterium]